MKLEWSFEDFKHLPYYSYFNGVFVSLDKLVAFYFFKDGDLIEYIFEENGELISRSEYHPRERLPIPWYWLEVELYGGRYILFNSTVGFDTWEKVFIYDICPEMKAMYISVFGEEYHFENDDFVFDDYRIAHKGSCGYSCYLSGEHVWDLKAQAYLYTNIQRYSDSIVFGTAGHGGHFYIVDLPSGKVKIDVNTKGTSKFLYADGKFYLYSCGKKGRLLKIDEEGVIKEEIEFNGMVDGVYSPLGFVNNKIYALSFKKKKGVLYPVIHCISYP